jgi:lipoyl(octanoyl) transferase
MTGLEFIHAGFGPAAVPYEVAWDEQRRLHAARVADEIPDTCVLLEHPPVYTAGRRTNSWDRPTDGTPVVEVDRGGKITWHGPGQLVGYPIIKLAEPMDVVAHVRRVEEVLIRVCAELGLVTTRIPDRAGVWIPGDGPRATGRSERKVAAIGIRVSRGVSMHGFALNADCDLGWFDRIVPCGIADAGVTTLSAELGRPVAVAEIVPLVERHLAAVLGGVAAIVA